MTEKSRLRQELLEIRNALSPDRQVEAKHCFTKKFAELVLRDNDIGAYVATGSELSILDLLPKKFQVALPRTEGTEMSYVSWRPGATLIPGKFGILEPAGQARSVPPSTILVPCVGGTRDGWRLGYGAGYFDRFLKAYPRTVSIGIVFRETLLEEFPFDSHDIPLSHMFVV